MRLKPPQSLIQIRAGKLPPEQVDHPLIVLFLKRQDCLPARLHIGAVVGRQGLRSDNGEEYFEGN